MMKREAEARRNREKFLERLQNMQMHIPEMTEEEFYTWENGDEEYTVPLIKKYLRTPEHKTQLDAADLTIEDCLNGRYTGDQEDMVHAIYNDWNTKLGEQHFGS